MHCLIYLLIQCIAYQTEWTFRCKNGEDFITFYAGCSYNVQLWGANGGKGLKDGNSADGGVGAYINGTIKLATEINMQIRVGEAGKDGVHNKGGLGGYNGGAKGGDDNGINGNDAAGGGGGATDIGFSNGTRIAAAGAGSGASCGVFGAPGAGVGEHGDLESGPKIVFVTNGGTGTSSGQAGQSTIYCPGSGGGGGWEGGVGDNWAATNYYTSVAQSGSSGCLSEYMTDVSVLRGNDPNMPSKPDYNGYAIVKLTNPNDITCLIPRPSPTASRSISPSPSRSLSPRSSPSVSATQEYTEKGNEKLKMRQSRTKIIDTILHASFYFIAW